MTTMVYPDYAPRDITRAAVRAQLHASPHVHGYFGLSPFDVPESVTATVLGSEVLIFHFEYANNESAEHSLRAASHDGRIDVVLGRVTYKVLQVYVHSPREILKDRIVAIDPECVQSWVRGLPPHAAKTSKRNASLINTILEAMPAAFRRALIQAIDVELTRDSQPGSR